MRLIAGYKNKHQPISVCIARVAPCGVRQSPQRKGSSLVFYQAVAVLLLNTLLIFACFELAARGVFKMARVIANPTAQLVGERNPRETVSYYQSQAWAEQYWYEFRLSGAQNRYYPYVGWRRAPFKGQTIEIDQHGVRVTPGADCRPDAFHVFAFGESGMWGTGAPNWGTIPAYLQQGLAKLRPEPVCVRNFAEHAYVSMQDLIMLLLQLRSGNRPDVVLFYNIGGDIYSAYQSGRAGLLENFGQIAARFEGRQEPATLVNRLRRPVNWLRRTDAYALLDQLLGKLTIAQPPQHAPTPRQLVTYESMGIDVAALSGSIVQDYMGHYQMVEALAHKYGFKAFFFLPPTLALGHKPLTPEEQAMTQKLESEAALYKLIKAVYHTIERDPAQYAHFYSLVHIFDDCDALMFIDTGHVTPIGNELIAKRMLDIIQAY